MGKGPLLRLRFRIHLVPNRSALHMNNGLVTVLPGWRCGQAIDIFGIYLFQHSLETDCRYMMAFVHNDYAIVFYQVFDFVVRDQGLDDRNIHDSGQIPFRTAKLSNQRAFFPAPSLLWQFRERFLDFQKLR